MKSSFFSSIIRQAGQLLNLRADKTFKVSSKFDLYKGFPYLNKNNANYAQAFLGLKNITTRYLLLLLRNDILCQEIGPRNSGPSTSVFPRRKLAVFPARIGRQWIC